MRNHNLESETEATIINNLKGGATINKPNGGFPPIVICNKELKEKDMTKKYESSTHIINMQTILDRKADIKPFFTI